jgi:hypothetical protein
MWYCILILAKKFLSLNSFVTDVYGAIGVARVCVGRVANLCGTHLGMIHLILTYEMCGFRIV